MKVVVEHDITHCWRQCPYFCNTQKGMECGHPYFNGKPFQEKKIISHSEDIVTGFPSKCPLLYISSSVNFNLMATKNSQGDKKAGVQFSEGAESFRKMLLLSIKPVFWPHIEGVFQVFSEINGFKPKEILDDVISEKNSRRTPRHDNKASPHGREE